MKHQNKVWVLVAIVAILGLALGGYFKWKQSSYWTVQPTVIEEHILDQTFLDENLKDLGRLLQSARVTPYLAPEGKGDLSGFIIDSIEPNSFFSKVGLQNKDIVVRVNDILLKKPQAGLEIFQKLKGRSNTDVIIRRNEEWLLLRYSIK